MLFISLVLTSGLKLSLIALSAALACIHLRLAVVGELRRWWRTCGIPGRRVWCRRSWRRSSSAMAVRWRRKAEGRREKVRRIGDEMKGTRNRVGV